MVAPAPYWWWPSSDVYGRITWKNRPTKRLPNGCVSTSVVSNVGSEPCCTGLTALQMLRLPTLQYKTPPREVAEASLTGSPPCSGPWLACPDWRRGHQYRQDHDYAARRTPRADSWGGFQLAPGQHDLVPQIVQDIPTAGVRQAQGPLSRKAIPEKVAQVFPFSTTPVGRPDGPLPPSPGGPHFLLPCSASIPHLLSYSALLPPSRS